MSLFRFIRKYKLIHILFWLQSWYALVHMLLQHSKEKSHFIIYYNSSITILCQIILVYTVVYYLLPKFFYKKKYLQFTFYTLLSILASSYLSLYAKEFSVRLFYNPNYSLNHKMVLISNLMDAVILVAVFIILYLAEYYFLKDKKNGELEQQRLRAELDFLRAQINPHFLFNALNSVHVMMREDVKLAEQTLMEFSALLRYQLYECNNNSTILEKEIFFLKNYIALEQLRNGEDLKITYEYPEIIPYYFIAPFMLIPFVENAFKHVSHFTDHQNSIYISILVSKGKLNLKVENTYEQRIDGRNLRKGIGLENAQRRLELLYPKKHHLAIESNKTVYRVNLEIDLHEN